MIHTVFEHTAFNMFLKLSRRFFLYGMGHRVGTAGFVISQ